MSSFTRESRRKTPVIVAIKGKDREFGEAAISRVSETLTPPSPSHLLHSVNKDSRTILLVSSRTRW